ncbi:MAG: DNA mismatch repair endonuclease MutL [Christensenellales bacterium]|jgi:DNA mismatch repair protein MutL
MIQVLSAETAMRIAAGEVVERPSSVAKELLENALDAGSTSVTVELDGGGISLLRVTDNGCGIAPNEARLAFENHATSKIKNASDLDDIRSFGFRGEALPSIASVAKVEMTTRVKGAAHGVKISIEGGKFLGISDVGCPEGTTIVIRDLFFNTPVRYAFLRKPSYEAGIVMDTVQKLMLGNPSVAIRLINAKKTVCQSYGDGDLRHAALSVFGRETASRMIEIDESSGGYRLWGLIGVGDCAKTTRGAQSFFINGRLVRCPMLAQALEEACREQVTVGMYPMCALHVSIPPHSVDVNVHPSKLEVRFRDEFATRQTFSDLLHRALADDETPMLTEESIRQPAIEETKRPEIRTEIRQTEMPLKIEQSAPQEIPHIESAPMPVLREIPPPAPSVLREAEPQSENAFQPQISYRVIGTLFDTYLLLEAENALVMIDQHAAHERILYERLMKQLDMGIKSQPLLTPIVLSATKREQAILTEQRELLLSAGYDVEPFGERDVRVLAVPFVMGRAELAPLFMELIESLDTLKSATLDMRREQIIQLSCKKAIKGGDRLKEAEIEALLKDLQETGAPATCPHGRPVLRVLSKNEMERMFKRRQ